MTRNGREIASPVLCERWHILGYAVVVRGSIVYLVKPNIGVVIHAHGKHNPLACENVNRFPWHVEPAGLDGLEPGLRREIELAAAEQIPSYAERIGIA